MDSKVEKIIINYINKSSNVKELEFLSEWIKDDANKEIFDSYVKTNFQINLATSQIDDALLKDTISKKIKYKKRSVINLIKYSGYAAAIVVLFAVLIKNTSYFNGNKNLILSTIKPGEDKAILTLEDGEEFVLNKATDVVTEKFKNDGENLIYNKEDNHINDSKIAYNYLTVPRGGQYHVVLSDGTEVWLNSDSQLKYPVHFKKGETRQIELVYGEAYFDVSPSSLHNGSNFKVFTKEQEVNVLGTEFNIKAYSSDNAVYTTLIEGSVAISNSTNNSLLKPNQQAILKNNKLDINVSNIDVYNEISWKEGLFSFKDKTLKDIMNTLSRWYNIEIIFKNKDLENELFGGVFDKSQEITEILSLIQSTSNVSFKLEKGKIVIE
ncbi:FecR family protein [Polaribacter sp. Q13]|uniref:FecR family protein n=1 Tax=Polaribacter sp. Q13 TaxID=2806551 RepID=UPI00193C3E62|nr:FecR family protein [Polaribacter sp. Q13]QVY65008.1 FecR family protein [Polaribacter sp. Q13]